MSVKEKLVHILASKPELLKNLNISIRRLMLLADHLIENGVTISECNRDCANCWKTKLVNIEDKE